MRPAPAAIPRLLEINLAGCRRRARHPSALGTDKRNSVDVPSTASKILGDVGKNRRPMPAAVCRAVKLDEGRSGSPYALGDKPPHLGGEEFRQSVQGPGQRHRKRSRHLPALAAVRRAHQLRRMGTIYDHKCGAPANPHGPQARIFVRRRNRRDIQPGPPPIQGPQNPVRSSGPPCRCGNHMHIPNTCRGHRGGLWITGRRSASRKSRQSAAAVNISPTVRNRRSAPFSTALPPWILSRQSQRLGSA